MKYIFFLLMYSCINPFHVFYAHILINFCAKTRDSDSDALTESSRFFDDVTYYH